MEVKEIVDTFNDAMRDIRAAYWSHPTEFQQDEKNRKILADGIMKMEKIMDPIWAILKTHQDK